MRKPNSTKKSKVRMGIILKALSQGTSITGSAARAGVCEKTYYNWVNKDPEFKEKCDIALAISESKWVEGVNELAEDQEAPHHVKLNALKFLLGRRHPKHWSENQVIDITNDDGLSQFKAMIEQTNETNEESEDENGE